ncbi:MAG: hypothetical protein QW331_01325 [Candidatus Woesearchaeota archaeon]
MEAKINQTRFRHFVKHLNSAQQKLADLKETREKLQTQIEKVKRFAISKRIKPPTIKKEMQVLDQHIREAINKEKKLLYGQASIKVELHQKINQLEKMISSLQQEMNRLEIELAQARASSRNSDELKAIISEIKQGVEREEKIEESIQAGVNKNLQEILKIEEEIRSLENKFFEIKKQGEHPGLLARVGDKLSRLRGRAYYLKKKEMEKTREEKIPFPSPQEISKKNLPEEMETGTIEPPFPVPRHELKLEFEKEKPLEIMPEEMPALETADEVEQLGPLPEPPLPQKKKSLFKRLF